MLTAEARLPKTSIPADNSKQWLVFIAILCGALAVLFYQSFVPGQVLFANDGTLGAMKAASNRLPGRFTGYLAVPLLAWHRSARRIAKNLNHTGNGPFPEIYLKVYAPFTLLFLGFSAWIFFRQLGFDPMVCALGGVAAGLNMHFFSIACWGLGSWNLAAGMIFLALAALSTNSIRQTWAKAVLAGLAVGMNVMEGFDVGAILSLYAGASIVFRAFNQPSGLREKARVAAISLPLVALFAAFIAADTMSSLFETEVKDVARISDKTPLFRRWDFATQWSLPKLETLRILIPGLFGYRLDQYIEGPDKTTGYWGTVGQDARLAEMLSDDPAMKANALLGIGLHEDERIGLQSPDPHARAGAVVSIRNRYQLRPRHSGNGEYAGILVSLLAVFALSNTWRAGSSPYSPSERREVWFWGVAALLSLLAAWGRHGFIYQALWRLPLFSSIRNPIKLLHPFHLAWVILAAYGLEALYRRYIKNPIRRANSIFQQLKAWFAKAAGFDKKWAMGLLAICGLSVVGVFLMAQCKGQLISYLRDQGFTANAAPRMIAFSFDETLWYLLFLGLSVWGLLCILSGAWTGARGKLAWIFLGAVLVLDLARSDTPWISYFDYQKKYSSNPVFEFLEQKPYEHRVIGRLSPMGLYSVSSRNFGVMYHHWLQNDFPDRNIQALDYAQWPRMPTMDSNYIGNFLCVSPEANLQPAVRLFQLTNTRFLIANASAAALLNEHGDPQQQAFLIRARLVMEKKDGIPEVEDPGDLTVDTKTDGAFALIEYTNALPRAKLYANWAVSADDPAALSTLVSTNFNPWQTVLVSPETPVPQAASPPDTDPGTVAITDYRPKYVRLQASARTPAILLLNDRISPDWQLFVDEKPAPILRCNYIMRGVLLSPGDHTVEFRFRPTLVPLYITLCAWAAGLAVIGYVGYSHWPPKFESKRQDSQTLEKAALRARKTARH